MWIQRPQKIVYATNSGSKLSPLIKLTSKRIAIVIEKSFQPGRERLEKAGYEVHSLVRIARFENDRCIYKEDESC